MNLEIVQLIMLILLINITLLGFRLFTKSKLDTLYCGIIGFSSKKQANPEKLALLMLHNSLERGQDNTGIYSLETGLIKSTKNAVNFLAEHKMPKTNLFIGHVRKASVGSKDEKNAHPFENDNIVLVHNGTLTNHWQLCRDGGYNSSEYHTDTQVLAKLIDDDSKKEQPVFSTLSEYQGFAALLFTDKRNPDILYAYRNTSRPLFYGSNNEGMYISSLKESLSIIGCLDIKEFVPYYLHTIKDGKLLNSIYYKEKTVTTTTYNNSTYHRDDNVDEFVKKVKKNDAIKTENLIDRWVKALYDYNNIYGTNAVKLTKDKWYFIEDCDISNNFDVQFKDDLGNVIWHNKYVLDLSYIDYPNNYAYAIVNIFDMKNRTVIKFAIGTIIQLAPGAVFDAKDMITCISQDSDELIDVHISHIRPATDKEVSDFADKKVAKINQDLKDTQKTLNFHDAIYERYPNEELDDNDDIPPVNSLLPLRIVRGSEDIEIKELNVINEPPFDVEVEILSNDNMDETTAIVTKILDILDDKIDDIIDITNKLGWDELKQRLAEYKDLLNESYNIDMVRESILADNKENK